MTRPAGVAFLIAALALAACQPSASGSPSAAPSTGASVEAFQLTVFAAASLTDAMREIESAYEAAVPGADLVVSTESSATLRTQIEEGAPADVFLSADTANPETLAEEDLCDRDPVSYAGNSLALVVPGPNDADVQTPADLANEWVRIIAAGPEVPISGYAAVVLANLAALPGYPEDFAAAYAAQVVSEEENVRAVLTKIELGEGDAAFVYQTDALAGSTAIRSIPIPPEANAHATYAGCVIADSDHLEQAEAFLAWLTAPAGRAILGEFGFVAP